MEGIKVHSRKGEGSCGNKSVVEEVNVESLWDGDDMELIDDDKGEESDLETFEITKMSAV